MKNNFEVILEEDLHIEGRFKHYLFYTKCDLLKKLLIMNNFKNFKLIDIENHTMITCDNADDLLKYI